MQRFRFITKISSYCYVYLASFSLKKNTHIQCYALNAGALHHIKPNETYWLLLRAKQGHFFLC